MGWLEWEWIPCPPYTFLFSTVLELKHQVSSVQVSRQDQLKVPWYCAKNDSIANAYSTTAKEKCILCISWSALDAMFRLSQLRGSETSDWSRCKGLSLTFIPVWVAGANKEVFRPFLQGIRKLWLNLFLKPLAVVLMQYNKKIKEKNPGELSLFFPL